MSDFRSDTVTRPSAAMREAMAHAELGDDVFGDDPSVTALQAEAAEMLGFEAALFAPSGTQSNLIGIMAQCARGDEVIVGQWAHTYRWEGGGMAVLGSIQPQPIENARDGSLPLDKVRAAIKPDDPHFARTTMIALENTYSGKALPVPYLLEAKQLAREAGLSLHLDGARLFNAAVFDATMSNAASSDPADDVRLRQGQAVERWPGDPSRDDVVRQARRICEGFDTVSVCLSKGLGCPVGSLLLGSAETIARGRRTRKMLGGGMRQAGVLAAAGMYALTNNLGRLRQDHQRARRLADGLLALIETRGSLGEQVTVDTPQTNMVFIDVESTVAQSMATHLERAGLRFTSSRAPNGRTRQRWVTHLDIDDTDIDRALDAWASWQ